MSKPKRLISLFLVFAMLFSLMIPVTVSASGSSASKSHAHVYKQLPGRSLYSTNASTETWKTTQKCRKCGATKAYYYKQGHHYKTLGSYKKDTNTQRLGVVVSQCSTCKKQKTSASVLHRHSYVDDRCKICGYRYKH